MHKSRLGGLIIDCQTDNLEAAAEFWSQALGYPPRHSNLPEDDNYIPLDTAADDLLTRQQYISYSGLLDSVKSRRGLQAMVIPLAIVTTPK